MAVYISFLRGVNMTGHNKIRMVELAALYRDLGFADAETYIQSGNVIFKGAEDLQSSDISARIETAIKDIFGFKIPAMIRSAGDLEDLALVNPFLNEDNFNPAKMAVIFLQEEVSAEQCDRMATIDYPPDKFMIEKREIFVYCPNGFGKTKLYTNFFENKMGVTGTARNWKTITTISAITGKRL